MLCPNAPYFIILLCLIGQAIIFAVQEKSAGAQWVIQTICPCGMKQMATR
jgi:hypothetical protein